MKRTPEGTSVGVEDPYAHADRCDHVTSEGRCRFPLEHGGQDPEFSARRREDDLACPVAEGDWEWPDCPKFRATSAAHECARCGLTERRRAHDDSRPLLEEHHLVYPGERDLDHEITVTLCRWCHAAVHDSWARVGDDASPTAEALAAAEERRSRELEELSFDTAAQRRGED